MLDLDLLQKKISAYIAAIDIECSALESYINNIRQLGGKSSIADIERVYAEAYKKLNAIRDKHNKKIQFINLMVLRSRQLTKALIGFAELLEESDRLPDITLRSEIEKLRNKYQITDFSSGLSNAGEKRLPLTSIVLHETMAKSLSIWMIVLIKFLPNLMGRLAKFMSLPVFFQNKMNMGQKIISYKKIIINYIKYSVI